MICTISLYRFTPGGPATAIARRLRYTAVSCQGGIGDRPNLFISAIIGACSTPCIMSTTANRQALKTTSLISVREHIWVCQGSHHKLWQRQYISHTRGPCTGRSMISIIMDHGRPKFKRSRNRVLFPRETPSNVFSVGVEVSPPRRNSCGWFRDAFHPFGFMGIIQ